MKRLFFLSIALCLTTLSGCSLTERRHKDSPHSTTSNYVIGCDISTTMVRTGLFEIVESGRLSLLSEVATPTKEIGDNFTTYFVSVMGKIRAHYTGHIHLAGFSTPGITSANKDYTRHDHLAFPIDGKAISAATGISKVFVVNDFEVASFGVSSIDEKNIIVLQAGIPRAKGTKALVGAGNGLGSGLLLWNEALQQYIPSPLSYSFVEFNADTIEDVEFAQYLQRETGARAWGKVLGATGGILRMYAHFNKIPFDRIPYKTYNEVFKARHIDPLAEKSVALYMKYYTRLIRNIMYAQQPHNGIYIVNTIAQENPELVKNESFIAEILNGQNEYLRNYLSQIPIYFVEHGDLVQMYGAATYALTYQAEK